MPIRNASRDSSRRWIRRRGATSNCCAERFPFERYRSLCDVGGADALLSRIVAARHPNLDCISVDLPAVTEIATRRIAADGLGDRVRAVGGDFLADPLPPADVVTMGMILHDWNLERKRELIAKAYQALPAGGAFIVVESLIDDARRREHLRVDDVAEHAHRIR